LAWCDELTAMVITDKGQIWRKWLGFKWSRILYIKLLEFITLKKCIPIVMG
jgi:hypothetical protein